LRQRGARLQRDTGDAIDVEVRRHHVIRRREGRIGR
jgi:hypothetical protein